MDKINIMKKCHLCPRNCGTDRTGSLKGYCNSSGCVRVARAALHMWEEPCISGEHGSGTVFFSGCAMRCVFCQNSDIASGKIGKEISIERLAQIFIELQEKGAENINLVTPSHYIIQIIDALGMAKSNGLKIPVVYNSSGYEKAETIKLLDGLIDIYLPDFKYWDSETALRYSNAADYRKYAAESIAEMFRQTNEPVFDSSCMMKRGVIVRHLLLPGKCKEAEHIINYLYETYKDMIYISILNQYTPMHNLESYPELNRRVTKAEYNKVVDFAIDLGVENGFIQEGSTSDKSFIPVFDYEGV